MANNKMSSVIIVEASRDKSFKLQSNTFGGSSEDSHSSNELNYEKCLTALEKLQQLTMNIKQADNAYCTG